jgi:anaerobic ribonucleoside-triphosphate reductase activating protein
MNYYPPDTRIVFQEVPDEISLSFSITGCAQHCKGCHSPYLWDRNAGELFTWDDFERAIAPYRNYVTCILFLGGNREPDFLPMLKWVREQGYKVALYTGDSCVDKELRDALDYLKTGRYIAKLGGLNAVSTNQRFEKKVDHGTWVDLTSYFMAPGDSK